MSELKPTTELDFDELDRVSGGIIIVGGSVHSFQQVRFAAALDRVSLNPQPLPPKVLFGS